MTLAKAAPPDWAAWFANITGLPVEYVRHKLGTTAQNGTLEPQMKTAPAGARTPNRSLATVTRELR